MMSCLIPFLNLVIFILNLGRPILPYLNVIEGSQFLICSFYVLLINLYYTKSLKHLGYENHYMKKVKVLNSFWRQRAINIPLLCDIIKQNLKTCICISQKEITMQRNQFPTNFLSGVETKLKQVCFDSLVYNWNSIISHTELSPPEKLLTHSYDQCSAID